MAETMCGARRLKDPKALKPRRPCPVCGKWTSATYMHMIYSHNWTEAQVNELKMSARNEKLANKGSKLRRSGTTTKPRRPCTVCGKWTTAIYMHMLCTHNWSEAQVNELKIMIRNEKLTNKGSTIYQCHRCDLAYSSTAGLMLHLERCRCEYRVEKADRVGKDNEFEYSMDGQVQATNPKQLPTRPLTFPPLPEQMGESDKGSVLCPVPRCKGRFTNHDSLSYHCLVEHSELGAAGTPQDFSIRQYRFENKEELKDWLYDKCEQTCTSFATKTSMWSGYAMYRCNRAGTFKTSGTIRPGCSSKKAQTHCSAFLRTSEYSDGSIDVTCCFGHIFHELDPTALRLNERQCGEIRKLIDKKMSLMEICAHMRMVYPLTNRLHYTSSNDIRNLAIRLGLPIYVRDGKRSDQPDLGEHPREGEEDHEDEQGVEDQAESEGVEDDEELSEQSEESDEEFSHNEITLFPDLEAREQEYSSPSSTLSLKDDANGDEHENRPLRSRRAPRRFEDI